MRRVLIVSPHFPPVNAPDMQRARLALPHLRALGWEPVVLAVEPASVEGAVLDPLLEQTYPDDVRVVRVRGLSPALTRPLGFGSLWWRCGRALRRAGDELLAREKFDLVFFTTTQFDSFTLGPRWRARFGVPYVLDYQDPWVNDYYRKSGTRPPGGPLKYWLSQYTARRREPVAVRAAAAIVSVSSSYGPDLLARYPALDPARLHHLPFGAASSDIEIARRHRPENPLVPFGDGDTHLVYAGRCGPDMTRSLTLLFRAFRLYRDSHPEDAARLRFHFIGTDYAPPPLGRYWALPVAEAEGVADRVAEHCYRVPYFDALSYLVGADGILAVGSNDPTYSASKIFPCLLARRPLLAIVHRDSLMLDITRDQGVATSYGFDESVETESTLETLARRIHDDWFAGPGRHAIPAGDLSRLTDHTALGMSRRLAAIFDACTPGNST
jgi:hypothetical protein